MIILGIDTSGKTASCAVYRDGIVLGQTTVYTKLTHSQVILPFVERLLSDTELTIGDIDLIAVSNGPGSYTGLRIGVALVKGLCAVGGSCVGISTLEALAANSLAAKGTIFSLMKARPEVVYFGAYSSDGGKLTVVKPDDVTGYEAVKALAEETAGDIILTGDAAEEIKQKLFAEEDRVRLAPVQNRLQQATGVISAALSHLDEAGTAEDLRVRYLQVTKAEKDLKDNPSGASRQLP
ncbi:MAG: tRNA (adenosine(37)-N6)-threonylcarbamoyltransferase complex dimerization subunit type 1 TsaB [Oscillospiraceae bacterium]|nr:tRNA (adenosine(37)-N6)-threonylcarbamoyltransferase complex dimerization subunit type 1 TsaB [Oscillospiraceae bacterium]